MLHRDRIIMKLLLWMLLLGSGLTGSLGMPAAGAEGEEEENEPEPPAPFFYFEEAECFTAQAEAEFAAWYAAHSGEHQDSAHSEEHQDSLHDASFHGYVFRAVCVPWQPSFEV